MFFLVSPAGCQPHQLYKKNKRKQPSKGTSVSGYLKFVLVSTAANSFMPNQLMGKKLFSSFHPLTRPVVFSSAVAVTIRKAYMYIHTSINRIYIYIYIYVPVARRPQPPPPPEWYESIQGGGEPCMHPVYCPTVLPTCVLPNPFPRKGGRGGGNHRAPTHPTQGRGCTVGSYRGGGRGCTVTLCYLLTGGRVGTIDPPQKGRGACTVTLCYLMDPHPDSCRGGGGWEPWTPPPPHPTGGRGVVRSHCATFLTEHDHWGVGGGAGQGRLEHIYIYIYIYGTPQICHPQ